MFTRPQIANPHIFMIIPQLSNTLILTYMEQSDRHTDMLIVLESIHGAILSLVDTQIDLQTKDVPLHNILLS
jgi:hypothetical protein